MIHFAATRAAILAGAGIAALLATAPARADGTAPCNTGNAGTISSNTECGVNADTGTAANATALGAYTAANAGTAVSSLD